MDLSWQPKIDFPQDFQGCLRISRHRRESRRLDQNGGQVTERHLDRTDIKSIVELHHAMRTGMNLEATLLNRITNVETLLQRQITSTLIPAAASTVSPAITAKRVARILAQSQFSDTRILVVIIRPMPRSELRSIFSDYPNSIRRAIEDPPDLRAHGRGIRTGGAARFVDGDFIQTESYREVVNLYRDGELIVAARIDRGGLAWADKTDSRFHPLALVEFVTNTLGFFRLVLTDMRVEPQALQVEVRLGNLFRDSTGTSLPAGPINNVGWTNSAEWRQVRELASEALRAFGWPLDDPPRRDQEFVPGRPSQKDS